MLLITLIVWKKL